MSDELAPPRPAARILPEPDETSAAYWEAAARGVLVVLRCDGCRRLFHPPRDRCPHCGASAASPEPVSGRGVVHAITVSHHPATGRRTPFTLGLVALVEDPAVRVLGELVGPSTAELRIGTTVEVEFEDLGEGVMLPRFRPVRTPG